MEKLRFNIVMMNVGAVLLTLVFFVAAPAFSFPASFKDSFGLAQITIPVLLGYVGLAAAFAARSTPDRLPPPQPERLRLLSGIAYSMLALYVVVAAVAAAVFWSTNTRTTWDGKGLTIEELRNILTVSLGAYTGVTNHVIARLSQRRRHDEDPDSCCCLDRGHGGYCGRRASFSARLLRRARHAGGAAHMDVAAGGRA